MKIAIHQPQYLPWIGYFDKIDKADVFVLLDDVQYKKNEWQNRNRIRSSNGWQWITVPVQHNFGEKIDQVKIDNNTHWREDHYKSLAINVLKEQVRRVAHARTSIPIDYSLWHHIKDHFLEFISERT